MADIKVKDLTDTQTINTDDEIMVLTNAEQNQVQNITVENFITNIISSDSDNVIEQGTDGKLYVETPENITGDLSDLSTTEKSSLVGAINEVDADLTAEATTRANADNNLQTQIDAITASSDVTDIVGTYAQLQAYDTTGLPDNSIIKVLQDESRQNETTYYRWVITDGVGAWVLIGEEGPYYTISQADGKFATKATIGDLNNLATSDKSSVVNAMNELASVLDPTQTADYIKNSKAIYSGEVSENALILPQIKEMSHSTFDLSKFTVVGSPNITDDGIASGFSTSNYIQGSNQISFVAGQHWEIKEKVNLNSLQAGAFFQIFDGVSTNNSLQSDLISSGNIYWTCPTVPSGATVNRFLQFTSSFSFSNHLNEDVYLKFIYNGSSYIFGWSLDDEQYTYETALTSNSQFTGSGVARLAWRYGSAMALNGSIDLKQFSITVDGVEVFSGNKTGIDTIKPDDYQVVGAPTISADGVASNFTSSNYIKIPKEVLNSVGINSWDIEVEGVCNAPVSNSGQPLFSGTNHTYNDTTSFFNIGHLNAQDTWIAYLTLDAEGVKTAVSMGANSIPNRTGQNFKYTLSYNSASKTYSSLLKFADGMEFPSTLNSEYYLAQQTDDLYLGYNYGDYSINLNTLKVHIAGNLAYQSCLKIPYTQSKTGSKIVDSIYRDRVNDMAEQFGFANYYTLDEDNGNFTLPQVELYGYIEKRARDIAHPVAQPFYRFSDEINEDEVRLEGAEVDKGLYLAIEQDPYLSALCTAGSTTDKICLPDFRNRVIYGDVASGYVEPELPNITGSFSTGGVWRGQTSYVTGAFALIETNILGAKDNDSYSPAFDFDASRSSSIYKDGGTVKTSGVKARWLCRWK